MFQLKFWIRVFVLTLAACGAYSQNSLDDLQVIYKNDFEHNTLGSYNYEEWANDWFNPPYCNRFNELRIKQYPEDSVNPTKVFWVDFPENSLGPEEGGTHWESDLPQSYDEAYFSYDVYFMPGFQFQSGGKVPGVSGGSYEADRPTGYDGFGSKPMFKGDNVVFYIYYPDNYLEQYGATFYWGKDYPDNSFPPSKVTFPYSKGIISRFIPGTWHNVTFRTVLNTVPETAQGNYDGILEAYFDGELVMQVDNILWRQTSDLKIDRIVIATFFGGNSDGWRNPIWEYLKFDNFLLYNFSNDTIVPRGNQLSPTNRRINYWRNFNGSQSSPAPPPPPPGGCNGDTTLATEQIHASNYSYINGAQIQMVNGDSAIGYLDNGCYVGYCNLDFNQDVDAIELNMVVHPDYISNIEIRIDDPAGTQIGTISTVSTGDWESFGLQDASVSAISGVHDVYFVATDIASGIIDWFRFFKRSGEEVNHRPEIQNQVFQVYNNTEPTTYIGTVAATDIDGNNITYTIVEDDDQNDFFTIDHSLGHIYCETQKLDFINEKSYTMIVQVQDDGPGNLTQQAEIVVQLVFSAQAYYIDPENDTDPLKDGSKEHPFSSWSEVAWESNTYYLQKKGTRAVEDKISVYSNDIVLGSYGDGDKPVIESNSNEYAVRLFEKQNITIQDLHITGEKAISCIYIFGSNSDNYVIQNCLLEGAENAIRVIDGKTIEFRYNTIKNCSVGIYSYAENNKIYYNIFKNNTVAINITSSLSSSEIFNNVFYENITGVMNSYSDLTLYNNIFYLATPGDVAINQQLDQLLSDYNIFYPEQDGFVNIGNESYSTLSGYQQNTGLDLRSFSKDPLFINVYDENFALNNSSPAIDAGTPVGINMDFIGQKVPKGGAPDIGLIENLNNATTSNHSINRNDQSVSFEVYPNPSSGIFTINMKEEDLKNAVISIKNLAGVIIYERTLNTISSKSIHQIDLSQYPKGVYNVLLRASNRFFNKQIIII